MRLARVWLILGGPALLIGACALYVLVQDHPLDRPCPNGSRGIHPTEIHFTPSLLQHQSWVGIPPSEINDGNVVIICADRVAIGRAVMDPIDVASGVVELDIPTRWVDWTWLSGMLDEYRDRSRWTVILPAVSC